MTMGGMEGFGFLGTPGAPSFDDPFGAFEFGTPGIGDVGGVGVEVPEPSAEGFEVYQAALLLGFSVNVALMIFGMQARGDRGGANLLRIASQNPDIAKLPPEALQMLATLKADKNLNVYMMSRLTPLSAFAGWLASKDGTGWLEGIQDLPQWKQESMFEAKPFLTSAGGRDAPNYAIPFGEYYAVKSGLEMTGRPMMFANPWRPTAKQLFPTGGETPPPREVAMAQYRQRQQGFRQLPRPEDTPELTEEEITQETKMLRRFPTLFPIFKEAPEEERAEGFMPFVQKEPRLRALFEERQEFETRPRRTRPIRFARL